MNTREDIVLEWSGFFFLGGCHVKSATSFQNLRACSRRIISQNHLADAQVARYFPKISCLGSCARANCEYVLAVLSRRSKFCLISSRKSHSQMFLSMHCDLCFKILRCFTRSTVSQIPLRLSCELIF